MKRFLRLLVISALLSFSCCYADSAQEDLSRPNQIYENANSQKSALSNEEIILQLKEKNRELEETHQKLFSYFMWLIATILGGAVILVLLNVRENKHKNKIIYNSEQFLQHSIQVQESERRRISQELHDSVAQSLRYVSLLAEGLSDKVTAQKIIAIQNENIKNIRNLCYNLTPPVITGSNMIPLIALLGQKIFDTENSDFQFRVVCEPSVDFANLNGDELMNIYRIVQEALQNIQKHAQASEATVFFKKNEPKSLKIIITDDGCGMSESLISQINDDGGNIEPMHFGLRNIFERAKLIGGSVTYFSEEGFGTWITVEI
ncbi:MAG: hypothetical protein IJP61_01495 [Treponema sp.]|nr:hypothetical protein [Treponema sp.]